MFTVLDTDKAQTLLAVRAGRVAKCKASAKKLAKAERAGRDASIRVARAHYELDVAILDSIDRDLAGLGVDTTGLEGSR